MKNIRNFRAAVFQFTPKTGDKLCNLNRVAAILREVKTDLFVLPEFFSTGISHKSFVEEPENADGGDTIDFMRNLAVENKTNIVCGTVIEKDGSNLYNTTFVLNRNGDTAAKYRKIHLFDMYGGSEDKRITRGNEPVVAALDIGNAGLSICYDIRFPLHFNELKNLGADFFVCPTAWGYSSDYKNVLNWKEVWNAFNISRANENNKPVISANQTGESSDDFYCIGNSMITDKNGKTLVKADSSECIIEAIVEF